MKEEESRDTSMISHDSSLASINIQNNEYDYNRFYSMSQKDNSAIEIDDANKRSANDSFGHAGGSLTHLNDRLFSQEDIFKEEDLDQPPSLVNYGPVSADSGATLNAIQKVLTVGSRPHSNLESPKYYIQPENRSEKVVFQSDQNQLAFSPSAKVRLESDKSKSHQSDLRFSGSLNIKELGSATNSDINELLGFPEPPGTRNYTSPGSHSRGYHEKPNTQNVAHSGQPITFGDIVIKRDYKGIPVQGLKTPERIAEHTRRNQENHFLRPSPNNSDFKDSKIPNLQFSSLEDVEERMMASDGLQEKEFNIGFKRESDSNPGSIKKLFGKTVDRDITPTRNKAAQLYRETLPKVRVGPINSDALLKLEQKYLKDYRSKVANEKSLQSYRKDSVGRKLRDTLVGLKTKGAIAQPFKKKGQMMYLKANGTSSKSSQNSSAVGKLKPSEKPEVKIQKASILDTLNSMILKSRKGSVNQRTSRDTSLKSNKSSSNHRIPQLQIPNQPSSSNRILQVLQNRAITEKNSRSASHKASKRRNLFELHSQPREQSITKSEVGHQSEGSEISVLQLVSSKISSNSTKRLWLKIFSKDKTEIESRSDSKKSKTHLNQISKERIAQVSSKTPSQSQTNIGTDRRKNLELDKLIKKMYESGAQTLGHEFEAKTERPLTTQDLNRGTSAIFNSKKSLMRDSEHPTSTEKSSVAVRRSKDKPQWTHSDHARKEEITFKEIHKNSLISSKTNPELILGILNEKIVQGQNGTNSGRNQFIKSKEQNGDLDKQHKLSNKQHDPRYQLMVEHEEQISTRNNILSSARATGESTRSGTLRTGVEFTSLPRCPTEGGLSNHPLKAHHSRLLTYEESHTNKLEWSPSEKVRLDFKERKGTKPITDHKEPGHVARRAEVAPRPAKSGLTQKPRLITDFLASFENKYRESE